jgi:hypothetical protein
VSEVSEPSRQSLTRPSPVRIWLVTLLALLAFLRVPTTASAADCSFVLGFSALDALIPTIVGNCLTNERHAANGDAVQSTTGGLLVWRKADNFTAFTDGYRTWVNGPFGLQTRLNTARFPWESDVAPSNVDPRLSVAYQLVVSSQFANLIQSVVSQHIPVGLGTLGPNTFGVTQVDRNTGRITITIDQSLEDGDPHDAAAVLVHEATHAFNFTHGVNITTSQQCVDEEFMATQNDLSFWQSSFGSNGKPNPINLFEQSENAELHLAEASLRALLFTTFQTYRAECGL